ncbi:MAG: hypothetical protein NVSMB3_11230 [Acidobacteriaceae bacterium]
MLRVGLTGGLGSGKSTVAAMLAGHGAHVLQADEIGREMMRPGQAVYAAIVERFGAGVVLADGELDRAKLAKLAFAGGRLEELNAIVHPAVIARQAEISAEIGAREGDAVVVVESALIFETRYGASGAGEDEPGHAERGRGEGWRERFDRMILVAAPEELKIARFIHRSASGGEQSQERRAELRAEARRRLAEQMEDAKKEALCDHVLRNDGTLAELRSQVEAIWPLLRDEARERQRG